MKGWYCKIHAGSGILSPHLCWFVPLLLSLALYYLGFSTLFTSGYGPEAALSLLLIFGIPLLFAFGNRVPVPESCIIDFRAGRILLPLTGLSTLAYLVQIAVLGVPPLFKARNKLEYFVFGVSLFFYLAQFAAPLAYAWWKISGKRIYLLYFGWNLFMLTTLMNKNPVMQTLCVTFLLHLLFSRKQVKHLWLKIAGFGIGSLGLMYSMFYFNPVFADYEGYFIILQQEQGVKGISDPIISLIYMYIASGWENFFNYLVYPIGHTWGTMFMQPVVKILKIDAIFPQLEYVDLVLRTLKSDRLTVATGFFRMYSDFGYLSIGLYVLIYFGLVHRLYRRVMERCTLSGIYFLVYLNVFLIFMFFDNYFFLTISGFGFLLMYVAMRLSHKRIIWRRA